MKTLIEVDIPIDSLLLDGKGDRSYREIASFSNVGHGNVFRILKLAEENVSGDIPVSRRRSGTTLETLRQLASALGVEVDEFVKEALREVGL